MTTTIRKLKAKTIENPYYRELLSVKGKSGDVIDLIDNHASIITQEQFDNVQNNFKVNNTKICK